MSKRRYTYQEAGDAMVVGVGLEQGLGGKDGSAKQLRAGVNSALIESAALAALLIRKGLITEDEYLDVLEEFMNAEVERYEERLTAKFGRPVKLAPHVANIGGETVRGEN
jgi:hypothetical protein